MKLKQIAWQAIGEAVLLGVLAILGWIARAPLVFASVATTGYQQIAKPQEPSSRPYAVVVGHLIGLGSGFLALAIFGAWSAPKIMQSGFVAPPRIGAILVAALLTAALTVVVKAQQPASTATALLVASGAMQTGRDAIAIVVGVILLTLLGEPMRRARLRAGPPAAPLRDQTA
jgi:hypothetical protein